MNRTLKIESGRNLPNKDVEKISNSWEAGKQQFPFESLDPKNLHSARDSLVAGPGRNFLGSFHRMFLP